MRQERPPQGAIIDWQAELAKHARWLRTVIHARLQEPEAVDDVMQEVSLATLRPSAAGVDPAKVSPWLYRTAVTQSLLYRRSQGRRRKHTAAFAEKTRPTEATHDADPPAWLLADERRNVVREAIARLPRRDAEILMLKYGEDWSYRELADRLGTSPTAIQARLHRARQRLRNELNSYGPDV